jgi:hypothetical protein
MSDTIKALIFCGVMIYITGMCTVVIINNSLKEDRACQVTYSHKDRVHVMVGSWK